jgi:hypothetical protein
MVREKKMYPMILFYCSAMSVFCQWVKSRTHSIFFILTLSFYFGTGCSDRLHAEELVPSPIKKIFIIHHSHTDLGFTDYLAIARDMHKRYLDVALDAAVATKDLPPSSRFYWTAESTLPVTDWWEGASPARRQQMLEAIQRGQIEITAMPFNQTPSLDASQWQLLARWLPGSVRAKVQPLVAMQNDVNGFPRAGALAMMDAGVKYLVMGINADSGGAPFERPSAFWWKMPDGRRLLVWLSEQYGSGYFYFEENEWRRGPVVRAGNLQYRPPRAGEIFASDETSVRRAHEICLKKLNSPQYQKFPYSDLIISITNMWRYDNDPPFPALADFVSTWQRLGLKPELQMTTPSAALSQLEKNMGNRLPEYSGEWTDWWANGTISNPQTVAASRLAKRLLHAGESSIWGAASPATRQWYEKNWRQLSLFDEHTSGSANSVAIPHQLDSLAQFNAKAQLAYEPMVWAEWLLGGRARARLSSEPAGLYLVNTMPSSYRGWVSLAANIFREPVESLEESGSGTKIPLTFEPGWQWKSPSTPDDITRMNLPATFSDNIPRTTAKFWVDQLASNSILRYIPLKESASTGKESALQKPQISTDDSGWPSAVTWPGMSQPLFTEGIGEFISTKINAFAPRQAVLDAAYTEDVSKRKEMLGKIVQEIHSAADGNATLQENSHTLVYTQYFLHPRLRWGQRVLEIWRDEPRVRLQLKFYRSSSDDPERFFLLFPLPTGNTLPRLSTGGQSYIPFTDQIPGTCRDYFAMDGWAHYSTSAGDWLWVSRDAPMVSFDSPQVWTRLTAPPARPGRLLSMVYDNLWYTNFWGNVEGTMEFQFDLVWRKKIASPEAARDLAQTLVFEPIVFLNPPAREDPRLIRDLFQP